jgi:hypothetical protein
MPAPAAPSTPIPVRANRKGFFGGNLIEEGVEFEIASEKQLGSWMDRLDKPKGVAPKGEPAKN